MGSIYEGELEAMKIATEYARQAYEVDSVFLIRKGARLNSEIFLSYLRKLFKSLVFCSIKNFLFFRGSRFHH